MLLVRETLGELGGQGVVKAILKMGHDVLLTAIAQLPVVGAFDRKQVIHPPGGLLQGCRVGDIGVVLSEASVGAEVTS
jgi:hypothetical protein